jgi:ATP-dependent DNA helicase
MDQNTKEERYKRLQYLLMKSNMYTEYLLRRMEKQREEEKKRKERLINVGFLI